MVLSLKLSRNPDIRVIYGIVIFSHHIGPVAWLRVSSSIGDFERGREIRAGYLYTDSSLVSGAWRGLLHMN